jgi:plastocyanin
MAGMRTLAHLVVAVSLVTGCGSETANGPTGANGDGSESDGPAPAAVTVATGTNFFRSNRNGSRNAAVDTVGIGGKVTWVWSSTGAVPHNVQSIGTPTFVSSGVETGDGSRYEVTFSTPGSYRYNCAIHGDLMTGTIVVR